MSYYSILIKLRNAHHEDKISGDALTKVEELMELPWVSGNQEGQDDVDSAIRAVLEELLEAEEAAPGSLPADIRDNIKQVLNTGQYGETQPVGNMNENEGYMSQGGRRRRHRRKTQKRKAKKSKTKKQKRNSKH